MIGKKKRHPWGWRFSDTDYSAAGKISGHRLYGAGETGGGNLREDTGRICLFAMGTIAGLQKEDSVPVNSEEAY